MSPLMDSAVLLGGESAAEGPTAAKALHHLEASCQLLDTAAPTPTASGALDDWQVVSLAEIQVALAGTLKHAPGSSCSPGAGDTPREPPPPVSPGKARSARSRRGRPKSSDRASRPEVVPDGADGDGEAAPKGAAKAPAGRSLPGRKPTGICAWNPFAGLGPKLMGPRHKAGAHILDLAAPPNAAAPTAGVPEPALPETVVASIAGTNSSNCRGPAASVPTVSILDEQGGGAEVSGDAADALMAGLANSVPDIDAAAAAAGVTSPAPGAGAEGETAPTPDYDTAKECGGGAGKGAAACSKPAKGGKGQATATNEADAPQPLAVDVDTEAVSNEVPTPGTDADAVPAVASNYSLPKGKAKKGKKKRAKK